MRIRDKEWLKQAKSWKEIVRFKANEDENTMRQKDLRIAEQIALTQDERYLSYKQSPEEILIDKERNKAIKDFWFELKTRLTEKELAYLYMFVGYKNKVRETARQLTVDEKNVRYYMKKIQAKAQTLLDELGLTMDDIKDILIAQINVSLPHKARGVGYPFEKYLSLPKNKRWTFRFGSLRTSINKSCMIPEYLKASGSCSICNICSESKTCTRCDAFPENAETETQRKHAIYIQNVLSDIKLTYNPQDFVGLERRSCI